MPIRLHEGELSFEQVNSRYTKVFKCPYCEFEIDADLNASINIAKRGYDYLKLLPP
ncbi:MAG: hypothetical protein B6V02_04010 [Thermoprotei archaeon ex4572_64]|nr:MAG: hypothetical protein B6V02_04010 [Thermoprotei archaeon ex4572_64]